ncbi:hypothetical protein DFH07DRAFT_951521 [Mycena maculata]|uniref:F-box domain-containing protein n=1 Tax=Mycena maculata TaxID=230809 RepID=A0AAD7NVK0_9AGAR|nr:hypothetical protein DFH07DRAFT_951521 [Mycena maculata]
MDYIAQELIDTILDFLHDDIPSLLSSSLVAKKWVAAPRHHIFACITINHFLPGFGLGLVDNAHLFLDICNSPHCSIIWSIRSVVFNVDTEVSRPVPGLLVDIIEALACAPVEKMVFIDYAEEPVSLAWIAPHLPGLREFSYNALNRIVEDIFALVSSFPALRILSIYSSYEHSTSVATTPYRAFNFAHLHTLRARLYPLQSEELLSCLQSAPLRLETLDLNLFHCYHNGWGPVSALQAFLLAENAVYLQNLTLRVTYEDNDEELDDLVRLERPSDGELDFSALTSLRTLHLTSHSTDSICSALASLPPSALRSFRYEWIHWIYYNEEPCPCNDSQVHQFVSVMQGPQFDALTRLDIGVPDFFQDEGILALREYFGKWKDDQRMQIERSEGDFQVDSWESLSDGMFTGA